MSERGQEVSINNIVISFLREVTDIGGKASLRKLMCVLNVATENIFMVHCWYVIMVIWLNVSMIQW